MKREESTVEVMISKDGNESGFSCDSEVLETFCFVKEEEVEALPTNDIINNDREKEKGQAADKNRNRFQIRRNISMGMYDVALLMANVSQLRTHLDSDSPKHYMLVLVFLLASILLHVISAVLLYILFAIEKLNENIKNQEPKGKNDNEGIQSQITTCSFCSRNQSLCYCWHMYKIDCVATFLVFVVTVLNVFITAFFDK